MLDSILAKFKKDKFSGKEEKETLTEHTNYVLSALELLKLRTPGLPDSFWEFAYIMCLFHDSGKISDNFQDVLQGKYDENVRHEMLSAAFLLYFDRIFLTDKAHFTTAVYSHHKPLNAELFYNDQSRNLRIKKENLQSWFDFVGVKVNRNIDQQIIAKLADFSAENYREKVFKPFYDLNKIKWDAKTRVEYIYAKAVLNIADWSASGHFNLSDPFHYSVKSFRQLLAQKLVSEEKIKSASEFQFRKFQIESDINQNILAVAPTGSGKTEASLLWASRKEEFDKIIYCLPTRVTSNAIYERLVNYFGKTNSSIVHSSAILYQKEVDKDYESRRYLRDKTFFSNITVCTIDQILTQGFNLGFWEVKNFHCRNARIIIDEIHLYQPYTLALILRSIEYLRTQFDAKFYIMSATMPSKLKILLAKALGGEANYSLIADVELLEKSRNTFEIRHLTIQENIEEIEEAIEQKKKVLIVVNTVDQAIELYKNLKESAEENGKKCICFHSRFIQLDRNAKEQDILRAESEDQDVLLIATQVVEVSLDIDYDILFTENAPIDALIQRAGRINRKRQADKDSKVIVHRHSEITEKFVYPEEDILKNTFQVLAERDENKITEGEFLELVDKVYEKIDVTEKLSFLEGWNAYYKVQSHFHFLGDCPADHESAMTRDGLDTINVIPWEFYEDLYEEKDKDKLVKHELSISRKRANSKRIIKNSIGFNFIEAPYSSETGLEFKKEGLPVNKNF